MPAVARECFCGLNFLRLLVIRLERRAAFAQQAFVLARQSAPFAQRVEAVAISVFVDQGGERADLFDAVARRHADIGFGAQPSPVVETVLRDEAQTGGDVILEPGVDLLGRKILCVGMSDRNIEAVHLIINVVGDEIPHTYPSRHGQLEPRSAARPASLTSVSIAMMPTRRKSGSSLGMRHALSM